METLALEGGSGEYKSSGLQGWRDEPGYSKDHKEDLSSWLECQRKPES